MNEIKKSWDDVTIGMWQELSLIESDSEVTKEIEKVSILMDMDPVVVRNMSMNEFRKLQQQIEFTSASPKAEVTLKFELDGVKYGMIPQLDFISAGEWADAENWKDKSVENIHLYAALLYRPITKESGDMYEIEPHKPSGFIERSNLFRDKLSITFIHGSVLFFSASAIEFTKILADYLTEQAKEEQSLMKKSQTQTHTKTHKQKPFKKTGDSII